MTAGAGETGEEERSVRAAFYCLLRDYAIRTGGGGSVGAYVTYVIGGRGGEGGRRKASACSLPGMRSGNACACPYMNVMSPPPEPTEAPT